MEVPSETLEPSEWLSTSLQRRKSMDGKLSRAASLQLPLRLQRTGTRALAIACKSPRRDAQVATVGSLGMAHELLERLLGVQIGPATQVANSRHNRRPVSSHHARRVIDTSPLMEQSVVRRLPREIRTIILRYMLEEDMETNKRWHSSGQSHEESACDSISKLPYAPIFLVCKRAYLEAEEEYARQERFIVDAQFLLKAVCNHICSRWWTPTPSSDWRLPSRAAHVLSVALVVHCTHCVEIHTGRVADYLVENFRKMRALEIVLDGYTDYRGARAAIVKDFALHLHQDVALTFTEYKSDALLRSRRKATTSSCTCQLHSTRGGFGYNIGLERNLVMDILLCRRMVGWNVKTLHEEHGISINDVLGSTSSRNSAPGKGLYALQRAFDAIKGQVRCSESEVLERVNAMNLPKDGDLSDEERELRRIDHTRRHMVSPSKLRV